VTAYFDCFSGIAGDMTVAALLDAGVNWDSFFAELGRMRLPGHEMSVRQTRRCGITASKFMVFAPEEHHHRHLKDIEEIIREAGYPNTVTDNALKVFRTLAEAEANVHGSTIEEVHFHEVGAVDSIVDIVGACIALEMLGITEIHASPLPTGRGFVKTQHGLMPVPAPATAELLKGIPIVPCDVEGELVTPTGAAILKALAAGFGSQPAMTVERIGYGAGTKDLGERPNLLRVLVGRSDTGKGWISERLLVVETNIDDMNPQVYDYVMDRLFRAGALDVWMTPAQMKKNRPGTTLGVLCRIPDRSAMLEILALETTTLGVRVSEVERVSLQREETTVDTPYGSLSAKRAILPDGTAKVRPEYDSMKRMAEEKPGFHPRDPEQRP